MESALLEQLKEKSSQANETIARLKSKIEQLKVSGNKESEEELVKRLQTENQQFKEQVEVLKKQLIELSAKSETSIKTESQPAVSTTNTVPAKTAAAPSQSETKTKQPKAAATPKKDEPPQNVDVSKLDIRIGKIIKCEKHPEADALYVEQIDLGEDKPRTVCSGLVKYIPLEEMQNRLVVLICNLKPAKLRGVLSEAMVVCASTPEKVELLIPPEGAQIGDRVTCSAYEGEPVAEINAKNKIFDAIQPDLKTNEQLIATYKGVPLEIKNKGPLKAPTLKNVPCK